MINPPATVTAMIDISFEINGKTVEPENMKDVLDITFMKHIRESIENTCATIRCPEHGGKPSIIVKGKDLDTLSYEVTSCCEKFINEIYNRLK